MPLGIHTLIAIILILSFHFISWLYYGFLIKYVFARLVVVKRGFTCYNCYPKIDNWKHKQGWKMSLVLIYVQDHKPLFPLYIYLTTSLASSHCMSCGTINHPAISQQALGLYIKHHFAS